MYASIYGLKPWTNVASNFFLQLTQLERKGNILHLAAELVMALLLQLGEKVLVVQRAFNSILFNKNKSECADQRGKMQTALLSHLLTK